MQAVNKYIVIKKINEELNGRLVPHTDQSVIDQQILQWNRLQNKSIK